MPMQKIILIGNTGGVPEIRTTATGLKQAYVSFAVNLRTKDRGTGEMIETTDWWRLIFFDKLAGTAEKYVQKGSPLYVEGRPQFRDWTDREGKVRREHEVLVDQLQLLGGRPNEAVRSSSDAMARSAAKPAAESGFDDDVPF